MMDGKKTMQSSMQSEMMFFPGTPYIVDPTKVGEPNTFATISAALAAAPSGAAVIVRAGTYYERLHIQRPVKISASTGAVLSWKSGDSETAAVDVELSGADDGSVLLLGLKIQHSSPHYYGVHVRSPMHSKVKLLNCDIASSSGSGVGIEGGNVTVFSCTVHDCKNHGVVYRGSDAIGRVERCIVENCKLDGLLLRDGASPTLANNLLKGNGRYGAEFIDCRGVVLDDNEVVRNGKGAVSGVCEAG